MIERWWYELAAKFSGLTTDSHITMPDHFHGVVFFDGPDCRLFTLGQVVGWFKTMTTNEYIRAVTELGWPRFNGTLWQRNYFERVVRNERELDNIRRYIEENPCGRGSPCNPGRPPRAAPTSLSAAGRAV